MAHSITEPSTRTVPYFVYGSLKDEPFQHRLFGRLPISRAAKLYDYRLALIDRFPTVVAEPNRFVEGVLLFLTKSEESKADAWEEDTYKTLTRQVVVQCKQSYLMNCHLYVSRLPFQQHIETYEITPELRHYLAHVEL